MTGSTASSHPITVLLIDDQAIVGEAIRRMLDGESDVQYHFCNDPTKAIEQANAIGPTVILQDLVMPEIDGLTLVKFFRANPKTRDVPMIVLSSKEEPATKAQAFAVGANDYLVKLPDRVELLARIRYHSRGYIAQLERNEAYRRLAESERHLAEEIASASRYVQSLFPPPMTEPVIADWRHVPSTTLGGDAFSYHTLDDDHLIVYLLDVSGHGVGSALLSVSVLNTLRSQTLPNTDFRQPDQVLASLNDAFQMDKQGEKYFTIWYGVYSLSQRRLRYASGGHPNMILFSGESAASATMHLMPSTGPGIGMVEGMTFDCGELPVGPFGRLLLFSDGVFEVSLAQGGMWHFDDLIQWLHTVPMDAPDTMDRLYQHVKQLHQADNLDDDFSMVQVQFR
jgi:sigma-B regulation protein RsbU (phosphoserine phosphatase)